MAGPGSVQSNFIRANTFSYSPAVDVPPNDAPGEIVPAEPGGAARTSKDGTFVRQDVEKMLLKAGLGLERTSELFVLNHRVAPLASGERELMKQLRDIGAETWATVGKDDIEAISKKLVKVVKRREKNDVESKLGKIQTLVKNVEANIARLGGYKAHDMALALERYPDCDDEGNAEADLPNTPRSMARTFNGAVRGLGDLAQALRELSEGLKLPAELRMQIDDMILTCDAHVSELSTLGICLVQGMSQGGSQSMVDLAKGMGGVMHGNYDTVVRQKSSVMPVFEEIERLTVSLESKLVSSNDLQALRANLNEAVARLKVAKKTLGGKMSETMDPKVLAKLREKLAEMSARIGRCKETAVRKTRLAFVHSLPNPYKAVRDGLSQNIRERLSKECPQLCRMAEAYDRYIAALEKYVLDGADPKKTADLLQAEADYAAALVPPVKADVLKGRKVKSEAVVALDTLRNELNAFFYNKLQNEAPKDRKGVEELLIKLFEISFSCSKDNDKMELSYLAYFLGLEVNFVGDFFDACRDQIEAIGTGPEPGAFLGDDVKKVLAGNDDFSDLLLASLYDVSTEWLDADLKDANLTDSKELGSGGVNTVSKLDYGIPDGKGGVRSKSIVFKPDFFATVGNRKMRLHQNAYSSRQPALKLNIASYAIADWLGCGNRVTKTTAMLHGGKLGIGMTLAPGVSAYAFAQGENEVVKLLGSQDPAERQRGLAIVNDILEQITDLQWLDLLTGQGDRHSKNYHIGIDTKTGHATVTGIDNDLCMAKYRTGLTKIRLNKNELNSFKRKLTDHVRANATRYLGQNPKLTAEKVVSEMMKKIFKNGEFDFSREDLPFEVFTIMDKIKGINSYAVPKVMSQTMYDKLNEIAADATGAKRKAFIAKMAGLMPKDNVDAFARRLDDLLALVKSRELTVIPAATADVPMPWLDGKIRQKVCGSDETSFPTEYKTLSGDEKGSWRRKLNLVMRDLKVLVNALSETDKMNSLKVEPKKDEPKVDLQIVNKYVKGEEFDRSVLPQRGYLSFENYVANVRQAIQQEKIVENCFPNLVTWLEDTRTALFSQLNVDKDIEGWVLAQFPALDMNSPKFLEIACEEIRKGGKVTEIQNRIFEKCLPHDTFKMPDGKLHYAVLFDPRQTGPVNGFVLDVQGGEGLSAGARYNAAVKKHFEHMNVKIEDVKYFDTPIFSMLQKIQKVKEANDAFRQFVAHPGIDLPAVVSKAIGGAEGVGQDGLDEICKMLDGLVLKALGVVRDGQSRDIMVGNFWDVQPDSFRNYLGDVLCGIKGKVTVEDVRQNIEDIIVSLAADFKVESANSGFVLDQNNKVRQYERIKGELFSKKPKAVINEAIENSTGLRQLGGNNCFMVSMVNGLLASKNGRDILQECFCGAEEGVYTFRRPFTKEKFIVRDEEVRVYTAKYSDMRKMSLLERVIWSAWLKVKDSGDLAFASGNNVPGNQCPSSDFAFLFGLEGVSEMSKSQKVGVKPPASKLAKWVSIHNHLASGKLAVVHVGDALSGHYVTVTGTMTGTDGKKYFTCFDSLGGVDKLSMDSLSLDEKGSGYVITSFT